MDSLFHFCELSVRLVEQMTFIDEPSVGSFVVLIDPM